MRFAAMVLGVLALAVGAARAGSDFTSPHFAGSENCVTCHDNLKDKDGRDVGIIKDESGSMMANAFIDPLWQAKVRSEIARAPALREVIVQKCSTCHAPMANFEAAAAGKKLDMFAAGSLTDKKHEYNALASEGVSCTLCHSIQDSEELGKEKSFSGHYPVAKVGSPEERKSFGPFKDVTSPELMVAAVQFTPTFGGQMEKADLCGTCHNLFTPFVDSTGKVASSEGREFPEQMAFGEWGVSMYSGLGEAEQAAKGQPKPCQECHMPPTSGVKISLTPKKVPARDKFFQHTFFTGNALMLDILETNRKALGITTDQLSAQKAALGKYMASGGEIEISKAARKGGELEVQVTVRNKTGHKLPTGLPSRRAYIHLLVADGAGKAVFESGRLNDNRSIAGAEADADETKFEPHYDVITSPDQVQVYEGIMGNSDGKVTYTLLRAARFLKDTRLLPQGFRKENAPGNIRPTGDAMEDKNFKGGSDEVTYRISGLKGSSFKVTAELNYQSVSYRFAEDLFKDSREPEVKRFEAMYRKSPVKVVTIASATKEVK